MTGSRSLTFSTARRPARRRAVRVVLWLLGALLVVATVLALTAGLLWAYAWAQLGGSDVPSLAATDDDALGAGGATSPPGTTTVLVALTTSSTSGDEGTEREDPDAADGPGLAGPAALLQVGGVRGQDAAIVLLPPELPVTVEGQPPMPLGQVHAVGGADLLLRTVVDYTEVEVDHVVTATIDALPRLVDLLGPVEVCVEACRTVDRAAVEATLAAFTADGAPPAEVVDATLEIAGIIGALGDAIDPVSLVTSPFATRSAIDVLGDEVTTDASLRGAALLPLGQRVAAVGDVAVVSLPGVLNPDSGRLVVLPEQAATRFALLREGGVPTRTDEDDAAALLAAATVSVQNGTGTAGYAASLETQLGALGVRVVGTENAASFDVERTRVVFDPADPAAEATAVLIAAELGDAELAPAERAPTFEGEPVTVQVVGGADLDSGAPDGSGA